MIDQAAGLIQAEQHAQRGRPMQLARTLAEAGLIAPAPLHEEIETERVVNFGGEVVREYTMRRWVTEWTAVIPDE